MAAGGLLLALQDGIRYNPFAMNFIYVLADIRGIMKMGVTADLEKFIFNLKQTAMDGHYETDIFALQALVYFERINDPDELPKREKQIKTMTDEQMAQMIEESNPEWKDLSRGWFGGTFDT